MTSDMTQYRKAVVAGCREVLAALEGIGHRLPEGVRLERIYMLVRDIENGCPKVEARIPITCEKLESADFEALAAVDFYQRSVDDLESLSDEGNILFVAKHDGEIIAGMTVETGRATTIDCTIPLREDEACTATVFTVSEYRGHGVTPALGCFVCRSLASAGFRRMICFVNAKNAGSLRSVEKRGYRHVGFVGGLEVFGWHWSYCLAGDARWRYREKRWLDRREDQGT
ncbi:MAG: N-acetyltransferase family protein [bacterium]